MRGEAAAVAVAAGPRERRLSAGAGWLKPLHAPPCYVQGIVWSVWKRLSPVLTPAGYAWVLITALLHGVCIACRWRAPRAYQRLRPAAALAYRLYGGGFGVAFELLKLFYDRVPPAGAACPWLGIRAEYVRHAVLMVMASSVGPLLLWAASLLRLW